MMSALSKLIPDMWMKPGQEWFSENPDNRRARGNNMIWTSGEDGMCWPNTNYPLFDYYAESKLYELGVYNEMGKFLYERGWFAEWNDPGTVHLCKI